MEMKKEFGSQKNWNEFYFYWVEKKNNHLSLKYKNPGCWTQRIKAYLNYKNENRGNFIKCQMGFLAENNCNIKLR